MNLFNNLAKVMSVYENEIEICKGVKIKYEGDKDLNVIARWRDKRRNVRYLRSRFRVLTLVKRAYLKKLKRAADVEDRLRKVYGLLDNASSSDKKVFNRLLKDLTKTANALLKSLVKKKFLKSQEELVDDESLSLKERFDKIIVVLNQTFVIILYEAGPRLDYSEAMDEIEKLVINRTSSEELGNLSLTPLADKFLERLEGVLWRDKLIDLLA